MIQRVDCLNKISKIYCLTDRPLDSVHESAAFNGCSLNGVSIRINCQDNKLRKNIQRQYTETIYRDNKRRQYTEPIILECSKCPWQLILELSNLGFQTKDS